MRTLSTIVIALLFLTNSDGQGIGDHTLGKTAIDLTALSGTEIEYEIEYGCSKLVGDCTGVIIQDVLPPNIAFVSAQPIIIDSPASGGNVPIFADYDPVAGTVTWDFTVLPEGGIPAGNSGVITMRVFIDQGSVEDGHTIDNVINLTSDDGDLQENATTTVEAMPQWQLSKSVASGPIYHDQAITYEVQLCSNTNIGNLNLDNVVIRDTLPAGAVFQSVTGGGVHDGGMPGIVTWNLGNLTVNDPCISYDVVVIYPSNHPDNNTGLSTPINKENKVNLISDPIGEPPYELDNSVSDPLLPPSFATGVTKEVLDNNILPEAETNQFEISYTNTSTVAVDDFTVTDHMPDQFDLVEIDYYGFPTASGTFNLLYELNGDGNILTWRAAEPSAASATFEVTELALAASDHISTIIFDFGTVPSGAMGTAALVVTTNYDSTTGLDSYGNRVLFDTAYDNEIEVSATRPIDGVPLPVNMASEYLCIKENVGRLDPDKQQRSNYISPPAGQPTAGNPYFPNSRVTYTIRIENDGIDGMEDNLSAPTSFIDIENPIGADLLPAGVSYVPNSWVIINNSSSLTLDNTGTNPAFEEITDFNGTGQKLLRWSVNGNLAPEEYLEIEFDVIIDTGTGGQDMTNQFCMSSATTDFFCDEETCGETNMDVAELTNYYGTASDNSVLIAGIDEMCCKTTTFTVQDSTAYMDPEKEILTSGPFAPPMTSLVEAGIATDTVMYSITFNNSELANSVLPNPLGMDLLPIELDYVAGSIMLVSGSNTTGLPLTDDGISNPIIDIIENYDNTGRTLLRWRFTGDFPIGTEVGYTFTTAIRAGSAAGTVTNDVVSSTNEQNYQCSDEVQDIYDLDGDGDRTEMLCMQVPGVSYLIEEVSTLSAIKSVKGARDTAYLRLPDIATTNPDDSVLWNLVIANPGNVELNNAIVVDVFPYIGDTGVQLNTSSRDSEWRPYLVEPIVVPPRITLSYSQSSNPCRTEINPVVPSPCDNDWSTTPPADLSTVRAVKFELNDVLLPGESIPIDIKMFSPTIADDPNAIGGIAWNSLARNADEVPAQEPNKVGVRMVVDDVALRKTLLNYPVAVGDTAYFNITVFNQGTDIVDTVVVYDYIPNELALADPTWTSIDANTATQTLYGQVPPGDSISTIIALELTASALDNVITNYAEIAAFKDAMGDDLSDYDATNDNDNTNDGTVEDDEIDNNNNDEDDHDLAIITTFYDYGDLPDAGAGVGMGDYETIDANTGPSHLIIDGLLLGLIVDDELDGNPSPLGDGDDNSPQDDEDGVILPASIPPDATITIPIAVTNTTGQTAYLEAWVDWNGDGDFDDLNEAIIVWDDSSGSFPPSVTLTVPSGAVQEVPIGARFRLSHTQNMTPYGTIATGEVEDYILTIECGFRCFPVLIEVNK